jgi:hypothetical protein
MLDSFKDKNADGRGFGPRTRYILIFLSPFLSFVRYLLLDFLSSLFLNNIFPCRTDHDRSSNKPSYHNTRSSNHDSSSSGYQPTFLTPQSLRQHNAREDKLHQSLHHIALTRIEQTQRLQRGLQSLGVDIPSDLYQARVSGYAPYNYNGEAPTTNDSNVPYEDDDGMNDILSDGQLFMPPKNYARPLPDAYAMQGMPWKANYFPQNWFEKEVLPARDCVTTQTFVPPDSYSNTYCSPTASPTAPSIEEDAQPSHLTDDESTYEYNNVDYSNGSLDGVGEQFASYGAGFEKAYQADDDAVDCGW